MKTRKAAWIIALTLPFWLVPLWLGLMKLIGASPVGFATAAGCLLTAMVLVAAYTDSRHWRIPNWATYTGTLWALAINGCQSLFGTEVSQQWLGTIGFDQSLLGFFALFLGMLIVTSFSGGGAGDVKMAGAIGSFLGLTDGFEAILVSFVSCAIVVLFQSALRPLMANANAKIQDEHNSNLIGNERKPSNNPFKAVIPLAPFFAFGAIAVTMRNTGLVHFSII